MNKTYHTFMSYVTHSCVTSYSYVTRLSHMWHHSIIHVRHDFFTYDMTYSCVTMCSCITRLSHMWHHLIIHVRHVYTYIDICIYIYIRHDLLMCDDVFMDYTTLLHVTSFDHSCAPCLFHLRHDPFTWHTRETVALPAYEHSQHTNKQMCTYIQACNA